MKNLQCKAITLRSHRKVSFELPSSSGSKNGVPNAEGMVQARTGSTKDADEGTEPLCQGEEKDTANDVGSQAPKGEEANQSGYSNSSKSENEVSGLEALIRKIIREGRRPTGE